MVCKSCKQEIEEDSEFCTFCGAKLTKSSRPKKEATPKAKKEAVKPKVDDTTSDKDRAVATLLAIFFGWAGFHHFYVGHIGRGLWRFLLAAAAITLISLGESTIEEVKKCGVLYEFVMSIKPLSYIGVGLLVLLILLAIPIETVILSFGHFKDSEGRYLK